MVSAIRSSDGLQTLLLVCSRSVIAVRRPSCSPTRRHSCEPLSEASLCPSLFWLQALRASAWTWRLLERLLPVRQESPIPTCPRSPPLVSESRNTSTYPL